jgi:hypothetical protein
MAIKISSKSPKKFKTDCRWASSLTPRLRLGTPQPRFATSEERNDVNYRQPEPTLEDILSDSIIEAVMKADGVDPHQLAAMLKELGRRWAEERPSVAQGRHNPTPGRCEHATPGAPSPSGNSFRRRYSMASDRFDWLILLVAGAIASVLLLAMTAYNAIAG